MSDIVQTGTLTVKYHIRHRPQNEEFPYDWVTEGGEESSYRFETIEQAVAHMETFYQ